MQTETESVKYFTIRLRTAAVECEFDCPNCSFDLSLLNIQDQLIRGVYNSSLQTSVLAKAGQLKSLEEIISQVAAFKTAIHDHHN